MSEDAEAGIARAQAAAAKAHGGDSNAVSANQARNRKHLDDRIVVAVGGIAFIALLVLWFVTASRVVVYGSFVLGIGLIGFWGWARIRRLERVREERARTAAEWNEK